MVDVGERERGREIEAPTCKFRIIRHEDEAETDRRGYPVMRSRTEAGALCLFFLSLFH